ncbi:MAG: hypothetical protein MEQ07_02785 [Aquimonas sp.]|nr:hypothetical protein [Aquimonas sp.]
MKKMLRLPVALALALGASNALALGLGQVQVKSSLNQPLLAEIPVLENTPGEAAELQVRLASADAFARIGLERPSAALAAALNFEVTRGAAGNPVIRITTANRINDPFLGLLVEAEWGRGKLLREYTLLLDPPVAVPSRVQPSQTAALTQGDVRPAPTEAIPAPVAPRPAPSAPRASVGDSYGPVADGDSLWRIARQTQHEGVNINQMMIALQRANPDAFIGGNINRLRKGAVLRIPSREDVAAIGAAEAGQQVREQTDAASLQPVSGTARTASAPAPSAPAADSRLAIVPPRGDTPARAAQTGAAADGQGAELRADLARAQEQGEALGQENRELRSRVQELEKLRSDSDRLLQLRNSELQALQQRLAELEAQRAAPAALSAQPAPPAPSAVEPAVPEPAMDELQPAPSDAPPDIDLGSLEDGQIAGEPASDGDGFESETVVPEPAPVADVAEPAPAPAAELAPAPRPAPTPWYQDPLIMGGGGAVLLGLLALLGLRRRGKTAASAAAVGAAGTGSRFEGTDFGLPDSAGDEVPFAADADDEEERELLDRLAEQPDDLERHLELVSHYYGQGNASRFEGAVEAMYAQVYDPDDHAWQQALAMGRELLPDHPLFVDQQAATGWEPADTDGSAPQSSDQSFDNYAQEFGRETPEDVSPEQLIDLSTPELEVPEIERIPAFETPVVDEAPAFDETPVFEYDLDQPRGSLDSTAVPEPESSLEINPETAEAAATKLELARAYLDMGDVEGARGMLEEVAQEGTSEQRQDARRLLDEIR